jgi:flagellar basal-body rod protein FlgG
MNSSFYIATTGVRSYQGKLDNIANNIANVDTAGFKRRSATFSENLTVSIQNQKDEQQEIGRLSPNGIRTTFGSRISATQLDLTSGAPKQTNNPYDLMIEGNGYFQVQRGTGEVFYTRSGSFQLSSVGNDRYQLVNPQGDVLLNQNGNPIEFSGTSDLQISSNGTIAGLNAQVGIVQISNPQLMTDEGGVYRLNGGTVTRLNQDPNAKFQIKQGYLEASNVELNQEMTDMIKAQRGLQANSRALSYADQMMGIANGIFRG